MDRGIRGRENVKWPSAPTSKYPATPADRRTISGRETSTRTRAESDGSSRETGGTFARQRAAVAIAHLTTGIPAETNATAGWTSPVSRKAHNLEIAGSNPAPATILKTTNHDTTNMQLTTEEEQAAEAAREAQRRANELAGRQAKQARTLAIQGKPITAAFKTPELHGATPRFSGGMPYGGTRASDHR